MRLGPTRSDNATESGGGGGGAGGSGGAGGGVTHGSWLSGGADFQSVAPRVSSLLERLQGARGHLLQSWSDKKLHLDQALQLHLFEQDAAKVSGGSEGQQLVSCGMLWHVACIFRNNI